jgi:hypothetical protein
MHAHMHTLTYRVLKSHLTAAHATIREQKQQISRGEENGRGDDKGGAEGAGEGEGGKGTGEREPLVDAELVMVTSSLPASAQLSAAAAPTLLRTLKREEIFDLNLLTSSDSNARSRALSLSENEITSSSSPSVKASVLPPLNGGGNASVAPSPSVKVSLVAHLLSSTPAPRPSNMHSLPRLRSAACGTFAHENAQRSVCAIQTARALSAKTPEHAFVIEGGNW